MSFLDKISSVFSGIGDSGKVFGIQLIISQFKPQVIAELPGLEQFLIKNIKKIGLPENQSLALIPIVTVDDKGNEVIVFGAATIDLNSIISQIQINNGDGWLNTLAFKSSIYALLEKADKINSTDDLKSLMNFNVRIAENEII